MPSEGNLDGVRLEDHGGDVPSDRTESVDRKVHDAETTGPKTDIVETADEKVPDEAPACVDECEVPKSAACGEAPDPALRTVCDDFNGDGCLEWGNPAPCPEGLSCDGGDCECIPDCYGKSCGPDGCGGKCGTCPEGAGCNEQSFCELCTCTGVTCGNPLKGCPSCGDCWCEFDWCLGNNPYQEPTCKLCTPDCEGKFCGPDGCCGSCGLCPLGGACWYDLGICDFPCDSSAYYCGTKECGPVDCPQGCIFAGPAAAHCTNSGECPVQYTCDPASGHCVTCMLECGHCAGHGEVCGPDYRCTPVHDLCMKRECGFPVPGANCGKCPAGLECNDSGSCVSPDQCNCIGRQCGTNGCGGTCGECGTSHFCDAFGYCVPCKWGCWGKKCGPGPCGGVCGLCAFGKICVKGECVTGWE